MSVRWMAVQYVGDTLRLPVVNDGDMNKPFGSSVVEREVKRVVVNPFSDDPQVFVPESENAKLREYAPEATLGRGTCKADKLCDGYLYYTSYWCRGCGERFAYRPIGGKDRGASPKFCPNCGAKFVGPTTNDVDAEVTDG